MNKKLFLLLTINFIFFTTTFSMENEQLTKEIDCFDNTSYIDFIKKQYNKEKSLENLKFTKESQNINLIDYLENNLGDDIMICNSLANKAILSCLYPKLIESKITNNTRLELITGPMFSGKTNKMAEIIKNANSCNISNVCFASKIDNNGSIIESHDKIIIDNVTTINFGGAESLSLAFSKTITTGIQKFELTCQGKEEIFLNEAQFFPSPIILSLLKLLKQKIKITCNGLNLSFEGIPLFNVVAFLTIIPNISIIIKQGECGICKKPNSTEFSMRQSENKENLEVGNNYTPVCKNCFIYKSTEDQFIAKCNNYKATFIEHLQKLKIN